MDQIGSGWIRMDQIGSEDDLGISRSTLDTLAACFDQNRIVILTVLKQFD